MNFPEIVACSRLALQQEGRLLHFNRGILLPSPTLARAGAAVTTQARRMSGISVELGVAATPQAAEPTKTAASAEHRPLGRRVLHPIGRPQVRFPMATSPEVRRPIHKTLNALNLWAESPKQLLAKNCKNWYGSVFCLSIQGYWHLLF